MAAGLELAIQALFSDANLARDASYQPAEGDTVAVCLIARRAGALTEFGDARLWSETSIFDVRVSDISTPRPGDRIILGEETFVLQGEPVRDRERLVWTLNAKPTQS